MADVKEKQSRGIAPPKAEAFGGPKKPALGAYFVWCKTVRAGITSELKAKHEKAGTGLRVTEVVAKLAELYKEVSEEKKAEFKAQSEIIRAKWNEEMEAWKKTPDYDSYVKKKVNAKEQSKLKKAKKKSMEGMEEEGSMPQEPPSVIYVAKQPIKMTQELDLESTIIRSIEVKEKLKAVEEPSDDGENSRIKCVAVKDKAEGFVSIKEGETEYLIRKKPRKQRVTKKKVEVSEGEGDEDTKESEKPAEKPVKKERKKRERKEKPEGEQAAKVAKKPRAMKEKAAPDVSMEPVESEEAEPALESAPQDA